MADSKYYKNLYKQKKKEVESYEDNLDDLNKILDKLSDTMDDEIQAINKEISDLRDDLKKSVRHNNKFKLNTNALNEEKEKSASRDKYLSVAISEIEDEITRIKHLKTTATNQKNYYEDEYKRQKEKERKELLDKLF